MKNNCYICMHYRPITNQANSGHCAVLKVKKGGEPMPIEDASNMQCGVWRSQPQKEVQGTPDTDKEIDRSLKMRYPFLGPYSQF